MNFNKLALFQDKLHSYYLYTDVFCGRMFQLSIDQQTGPF